MQTIHDPSTRTKPWRIPAGPGLRLFLAIAAFFLWEEYRAHVLGALPYVLLLACPVIHLFMHRGHAAHEGHETHPALVGEPATRGGGHETRGAGVRAVAVGDPD